MNELRIGDIVIGQKESLNYGWKGEVISESQVEIGNRSYMNFVRVRYENGNYLNHFKYDSLEVKAIGRKIPVINISDLI